MATTKERIELIFEGVDRASKTIKGIEGNLQRFDRGVRSTTGPLSDLTKGLLVAEAAIAGMAVAMGTVAYNAAVKFESGVADLRKVWNASETDLQAYVKSLDEVVLTYGLSKDELLGVATAMAQSGIEAKDATELLTNAIRGSISGGIELEQVADSLIKSMNGFGFEVGRTGDIVEIANQASNSYALNMEDMFEAFKRIAPIANDAGLSLEAMAGALTAIIDTGQPAAESARGLRTILSRLAAESKPVQEAFASLGIEQEQLSTGFESSAEKLEFIASRWDGLTGKEREWIAVKVAGADQLSKFTALMNNWDIAMDISTRNLEGMSTVLVEVETRLATQEHVINRARAAFGLLATAVGQEFDQSVTGVFESLTKLSEALRDAESVEALGPIFDSVNGLLGDFAETLAAIAENLPKALSGVDFERLANSISELGGAVGDLFGQDLSTVDGLRNAIQGAADGLALLNETTTGIIKVFPAFISGIQSVMSWVSDLSPETVELAGSFLGWNTAISTLLPRLDTLLLAFIAFGGRIPGVVSGVKLLATAFTSPLGLIAAFGAATGAMAGWTAQLLAGNESFTQWIRDVTGFSEAVKKLEQENSLAEQATDELVAELQQFNAETKSYIVTQSEASKKARDMGRAFYETGAAMDLTAEEFDLLIKEQELYAKSAQLISESLEEQGGIYNKVTGKITTFTEAFGKLVLEGEKTLDVYDAQGKKTNEVLKVYADGTRAVYSLADAEDVRTKKLREMEKAQSDATDKQEKLNESIEKARIEAAKDIEIANIEAGTKELEARLKSLTDLAQLRVDLDIAHLKSQTEIAKATINGITSSVEVVGGNISDIIEQIGALEDTDRLAKQKFDVFQGQLEAETSLFNQLIESQINYQDAQTDALRERVKSLRSGRALIEIDGAGLQPELEAFMFQILQRIQVRANDDAAAFLLGAAV